MDETQRLALARLQGMLEVMALLNSGPDCQPVYQIVLLPIAQNLEGSLNTYFSSLSTSQTPKKIMSDWHIRTVPCTESQLRESWTEWFWNQSYSPHITDSYKRELILDHFWHAVSNALGEVALYQVHTVPPLFYECIWDDFALVSASGSWLLHLGISD